MKLLTLILLPVIFSISVFAQIDRKGNGGDILVCNNTGSAHHLKMLDSYEASRYGMQPIWGKSSSWHQLVLDQLSRWQDIAPKRVALYTSWLDKFKSEANFSDNVSIPDIPDHGNVVLPEGCKPQQVALQRADDELFPGVKRYEIDNKYWNKMKAQEQAALVLHEIVYREAIAAKHINSIPTRYFTGFLMGGKLDMLTYFRIVVQMPFTFVEFGGGGVASNGKSRCSRGGCKWDGQIELWSNGLPKGLTITELLNSKLVAPGITCLDAALTGRRGGKGEYTGSIGYNEYGSINSIELIRCESSSFKLNFRVLDSQRLWSIKTISSSKDIYLRRFYPDIGDLANNAILLFPGNDGKVTTTTQSKDVYFEESDYLDSSIRYLKNYGWIMMPLSFSTSKGFFIIDRKKYSNIEKYITEEKSSKQYGYYSNIVKFKANGKWWKYNEGLSDWKSFEPVK